MTKIYAIKDIDSMNAAVILYNYLQERSIAASLEFYENNLDIENIEGDFYFFGVYNKKGKSYKRNEDESETLQIFKELFFYSKDNCPFWVEEINNWYIAKNPNQKALYLISFLVSQMEFKTFIRMQNNFWFFEEILEKGEACYQFEKAQALLLLKKGFHSTIKGIPVFAINSSLTNEIIKKELMENIDENLCFFSFNGYNWEYSFYSNYNDDYIKIYEGFSGNLKSQSTSFILKGLVFGGLKK